MGQSPFTAEPNNGVRRIVRPRLAAPTCWLPPKRKPRGLGQSPNLPAGVSARSPEKRQNRKWIAGQVLRLSKKF